jgi:hypothetical protein
LCPISCADMLSPLPRWDWRLGSVRSPGSSSSGLPRALGGSAPTLMVSRPARRSLTLRPVCLRDRLAVLCIEGFGDFVTSTAAPIATGWSESCRVGLAPTEDRHLFTAHQCNPSPGWQTGRAWPWPCSAPGDFRRRFPKLIASPMLSYAPPAFFARGLHIPCTWFAGCVHLSCRCLARNRGVTPSCNANHFLATS